MLEAELHKQEYDRKKAKEKRDLLNSLVSLESQMEAMEEEILQQLANCRFPQLLSESSRVDNVKNLLESMKKYVSEQNAVVRKALIGEEEAANGGDSTQHQQQQQQMAKSLSQSKEVVETVKKVKATVEEEIRRVNTEGEKEEEKRKREEEDEERRKQEAAAVAEAAVKREEESKKAAAAAAAANLEQQKAAAGSGGSAVAAAVIPAADNSSPGAQFLTATRQKLAEFEALYVDLATSKDATLKKIKFDLQKAVNTLVNSLANDPTEHTHRGVNALCRCPSIQTVGRLKKLVDLHCGRRVDSGSGKWVSVGDHPQGRG